MGSSPSRALRLLFVVSLATAGTVAACKGLSNGPGEASKPSSPLGIADGGASPIFDDEKPTGRLVAFRDEEEMRAFEDDWKEHATGKAKRKTYFKSPGPADLDGGVPPAASVATPKPPKNVAPMAPSPKPAPPPAASPAPAATTTSRAARGDSPAAKAESSKDSSNRESITNNQHAAVDEGDIVKLHGDHLVVLRRGRLFTISLKDDKVRLSRVHDAFGPDIDPRGTWYDEMVVEDDHVVVVGFSYERGGTEVGLFRIDAAGNLAHRATYHLKSNDYYSARNYASRIVDGRLVFYAPLYLEPHTTLANNFPAVRRWKRNAKDTDFVKTLNVTQLYHVENEVPQTSYAAMHTVTSCDLRTKELTCESVGVIGPPGRVFYVSPSAVYVWMQDWARDADKGIKEGELPSGLLAKLPITRGNGRNVTAVRVAGMPTDQFSFEEEDDGHLDVLVRSESNGDAMFMSEKTSGGNALVRLPRQLFSDEIRVASPHRYRAMPRPDGYSIQNRFVGPWLLFGAGNGYVNDHHGAGQLYAVRYASNDEPVTVNIDQAVDRIEPMGDDAVVVGSRGSDLVFTPIELGGGEVHARRDFVRKNASQGEMRSHGFFYKPDASKKREGMIGLPIRSEGAARGARYLLEGSASVLFLQNKSLELGELGALEAAPLQTNHDGCRASCVDWYGNARPIFAKGRIFALMGYELVEGRLEVRGKTPRVAERGRLMFAPIGGPPVDELD